MKNELRKINESDKNYNKAKNGAGYCYDWNLKNKRGIWDIVIGDFKAQWNLENDKI